MPELKIIISADGHEVTTDVDGMQGSSCEDLTENLFKAIGTVQKRIKKPEYYVEETTDISCNT